jgi:hypothetical protein
VLHRRLIAIHRLTSAAATRSSGSAGATSGPRLTEELISGALAELVALDDALARVRTMPSSKRRPYLCEIAVEVARMEALCQEAVSLAGVDYSAGARAARVSELETLASHLRAARTVIDESMWRAGGDPPPGFRAPGDDMADEYSRVSRQVG